MPFSLRIEDGKLAGRRYVFDQAEVLLGRTPESDLVVPDDGASRRHARISLQGDRYQVEDLRSANGTRVNGQPLLRPVALRDGDRVAIGDVTFTFTLQEQAPGSTRIMAAVDLPQWEPPATALAPAARDFGVSPRGPAPPKEPGGLP